MEKPTIAAGLTAQSGVKAALLALFFALTLRLTLLIPLGPVHVVSNTVFTGLLILIYLGYLLLAVARGRLLVADILLIWIIAYALLAAFQSQRVFGQPLLYGLTSQRSLLLGIAGIILVRSLEKNTISLRDVERGFLVMALLLFGICLVFFLFVDPIKLLDHSTFVRYSRLKGFIFFFNYIPIVLLFFYSLFKLKYQKKWIYLPLLILIAFCMIVFIQRRVMLFSVAICLLILFIGLWRTRPRLFYKLLAGVGILSLLVLVAYPKVYKKYGVLLRETAVTIIRGHSTDPSMSARMREVNRILPSVKRHWLLGTGMVSVQWRGGYERLYEYFYPSDLGLLGMIFVYGVLGVFFHYLVFIAAFRYARALKSLPSPFLSTCRYGLLYLFLSSLLDANILRGTGVVFLLLGILYYASNNRVSDSPGKPMNSISP